MSDRSLLLTSNQNASRQNSTPSDYPSRAAREYTQHYDWADASAIEASVNVHYTHAAQAAALARWCDFLGVTRTVGRHQILRILFFLPDYRLTQVEIAGEMQVTSANVTFLVDGLEKDDLVRRVPSLTDRRTVYVELTEEGKAFADRVSSSFATFAARMFEGFSDDEKHQFSDLLDRLRYNAEHFDAQPAK